MPEFLTQRVNVSNDRIQNHNRRHFDANDSDTESCETYLTMVITNPLTLKQLSRIEIRNSLTKNMKSYQFIKDFVLSKEELQLSDGSIEMSDSNSSSHFEFGSTSAAAYATASIGCTKSILKSLIRQLTDLPTILQYYLYDFPDIPHVPRDVDIFIND